MSQQPQQQQPTQVATQPTIRFTLHPAQAAFRRSNALYRALVGGRGSGKSHIGAYDLIVRSKPGRLYMVAAPTYTILSDATFRTFVQIARQLNLLDESTLKKAPPSLKLRTGAEVLFRSADDPEKLRGPNLSGVWLDEASLMDRLAYDIVIATLREGGERGWLSATFTPKGLEHWTYDIFGKGGRANTELFRASTRDNPFLDKDFASTVEEQYVARMALQELEGQFVAMDGAEWPAEYFNPSIWFDSWPNDMDMRGIGLDPSKGKNSKFGDYSAFVLMGRSASRVLYVDAVMGRIPMEQIIDTAVDLNNSFRPDIFAVEANQYQELLASWLVKRGRDDGFPIPVVPITNTIDKRVRIRKLGPFLRQSAIRFKGGSPGAKLLVEQLRDFPLAQHDDGPDALELILSAMADLFYGRQKKKGPGRVRA